MIPLPQRLAVMAPSFLMRCGILPYAAPVALLLLGSCASEPPAPAQLSSARGDAHIRLGPELSLLDAPVSAARAVVDRDGRVHVAAISRSRALYYVVVDSRSASSPVLVQNDVVAHSWSSVEFSAAFDDAGRFHVFLDGNHHVLEGGRWHQVPPGPPCGALLLAGRDLVCAFLTHGADVGGPRRWDWFKSMRIPSSTPGLNFLSVNFS